MVPQRMEAGQKLELASHLIFPINSTSAKRPAPPVRHIQNSKKRADLVCLIVMKEFITFQVCFWAKRPGFVGFSLLTGISFKSGHAGLFKT